VILLIVAGLGLGREDFSLRSQTVHRSAFIHLLKSRYEPQLSNEAAHDDTNFCFFHPDLLLLLIPDRTTLSIDFGADAKRRGRPPHH